MSAKVVKVSKKTLKNRKKRAKRNAKKQQPAVKVVSRRLGPPVKKGKGQSSLQRHTVQAGNGMRVDDRDFRLKTAATRNLSTSNYMTNLQNEIAFDIDPPSTVFFAFPAALTSLCLARGWMAAGETPSVPYLAFGYMCYILESFALNSTLPAIKLPKCLALVCQAVISKAVVANGGKVAFKFSFALDTTFPSTLPLGPTMNALWSLGVPNPSSVTDVWLNAQAPVTWTLAAAEVAYQSLTQFLVDNNYCEPGSMLELVPSTNLNKMSDDVSAFAVTYADPGGGYNFTGGLGKQIQLEVPIHSPAFANFYSNPTNALDINRYAAFTSSYSGSGFLLGLFATIFKESWTGMKTPPTLKCIDLNEFVEVYALILQKALLLAIMDPQTQSTLLEMSPSNVQAYLVKYYQCPLTLLEFSLLIRDLMMNLMKDTQFAVQDVFPRQSSVAESSLFTACVAGANTCALGGSTAMYLPRILAENMRSCTYALVKSGKNGKNPIFASPVLGVYSGITLASEDYFVSIEVNGTTYSFTTFLVNPSEVPISLVDGTTNSGSVVFVNDPSVNNMLTGSFNDWLDGPAQVSNFITSITTISGDAGVSILTNMNITLYWTNAPNNSGALLERKRAYWRAVDIYDRRTDKDSKKIKRPEPDWEPTLHESRFGRTERRQAHLDTSPYANQVIQNYSCRFPLLGAIWEGGQQFFIKPVINAVTEGTVEASNQISRIAAEQREFNNLVPTIGSVTQSTFAYLHDQLASMCVGGRNAITKGTAFEEQLRELSASGGASIFSDLAGVFGQIAVPLATTALTSLMKKQQGKNMIMGNGKNVIMGSNRI